MKSPKLLALITALIALSACQSGTARKQTPPAQQAVIDRAAELRSADPSMNEAQALEKASIEATVFLQGSKRAKEVEAKRAQDKFEEQLEKNARK